MVALYFTRTNVSLIIVVGIFSTVSLLLCATTVVQHGLWRLRFEKTTCFVVNVTYYGNIPCSCEDSYSAFSCRSVIPCFLVKAKYLISKNQNPEIATTDIYLDEDSSNHRDCSDYYCTSDSENNAYHIYNNFVPIYGTVGNNYTCYYDPGNTKEVLINKTDDTAVVVIGIFFPAGALFLIVVYFFVLTVGTLVRKKDCIKNWNFAI